MELESLLRHCLMLVLLACFVAYLANIIGKLSAGIIVSSFDEEETSAFHFPAVAVCSIVPELRSPNTYPSMIKYVDHDIVSDLGHEGAKLANATVQSVH